MSPSIGDPYHAACQKVKELERKLKELRQQVKSTAEELQWYYDSAKDLHWTDAGEFAAWLMEIAVGDSQ